MIFANALLVPDPGLVFWTIISFTLFLVVLRKFAWKPILKGLKSREESIENALNEAKKAREELKDLQSKNEQLLIEARVERDAMLKEAKETKEKIVTEAKILAREEGNKMIAQAKEAIENEKLIAMRALKEHVISLSIEASEMILKKKLDSQAERSELIEKYLNELSVN